MMSSEWAHAIEVAVFALFAILAWLLHELRAMRRQVRLLSEYDTTLCSYLQTIAPGWSGEVPAPPMTARGYSPAQDDESRDPAQEFYSSPPPDALLAELEADERQTWGAQSRLTCPWWNEQDEREAEIEAAEQEAVERKIRQYAGQE